MSVGRNAPCPCGSGKKYKQCCGAGQKRWVAAPAQAVPPLAIEQAIRNAAQQFNAGRLGEAGALCRQILQQQPANAAALNLLGLVEYQSGRNEQAAELLEQAVRAMPGDAFFHSNLGNILQRLQRFDEAERHFRRATALKPDIAEFHYNLGNTLQYRGQDQAAMECHRRALVLKPEYANAHCNLSMLLRAKGDLAAGWEHNAFRFRREVAPIATRPFPSPWWAGEPLSGKRLLVWGEQGVGDEILFASVLPDAIRDAERVIVECDPRLVSLFARSFPEAEVVGRSDPPAAGALAKEIDYQSPSGNLPRWYRPTLESFPARKGFLIPDAERVAYWKEWLESLGPGPKVGIAWRSMLSGEHRDPHYTALSQWGEILKPGRVVFVNLQYDNCQAELEEARQRFGVEIHMPPGINLKDELDEAAALTAALDLVITAGTSVSAIAGALGKETWRYTLDNAWIKLGTDHIPWLPSVRSYQKAWDASWEPLLKRIGDDLGEWAKGAQFS